MKRELFITDDGTASFRIDALKETYHSRHGAFLESQFVYIEMGIQFWVDQQLKDHCSVFELGFGSGLNAYLTANFAQQNNISTIYHTVENNPLTLEEAKATKYGEREGFAVNNIHFMDLHLAPWENDFSIDHFTLNKKRIAFENVSINKKFDVIFYDAFGAHAQPELWSDSLMLKCFNLLNSNGVWVSYCAKGSVRRGLEKSGFIVERLPGPPGKREMLRAVKP